MIIINRIGINNPIMTEHIKDNNEKMNEIIFTNILNVNFTASIIDFIIALIIITFLPYKVTYILLKQL